MYLRKCLILLINLCILASVYSIDSIDGMDVTSAVLWDRSEIVIELFFSVPDAMSPKSRYEIEQIAEENISRVFMDSIMDFPVDSFSSIHDLIQQDYNLLLTLNELSLTGQKGPSYYSSDFSRVTISYTYQLFGDNGLINPFINHNMAIPMNRVLGFAPTDQFTGVIIYAQGLYETIGPSEDASIQPALFPKLYDEQMNLILEKEMCNPETLRNWGMVAYSNTLNPDNYEYRVGDNPIKIMARMVYGTKNTDIVISSLNASQLLVLAENRELLANGNILIIYEDF